jgi:hypothetical protein
MSDMKGTTTGFGLMGSEHTYTVPKDFNNVYIESSGTKDPRVHAGASGGVSHLSQTTKIATVPGGGGGVGTMAPPNVMPQYKYAEGKIINDFKNYIDKTYNQHYQTKEESLQCFDAWLALGDATPTFRNTAMKYLWRYGKKGGSNKDDLMKVLHYTLMCLYNDHYKK